MQTSLHLPNLNEQKQRPPWGVLHLAYHVRTTSGAARQTAHHLCSNFGPGESLRERRESFWRFASPANSQNNRSDRRESSIVTSPIIVVLQNIHQTVSSKCADHRKLSSFNLFVYPFYLSEDAFKRGKIHHPARPRWKCGKFYKFWPLKRSLLP